MKESKVDLINSIVEIARDYEGADFNKKHVEKWLDQFPIGYHNLIIKELHSILDKTYFSKNTVIKILKLLIESEQIFSQPIEEYSFINPQVLGSSQKEILGLLNEVIQNNYGFSIEECGKENITSYVYIDDAIYSGNRVIRDIQKWVSEIDDIDSISRVDIIVLALHNRNYNYVYEQIQRSLPNTQIFFWRAIIFYDSLWGSDGKFESYWPSFEMEYNDQANQYIETVKETRSEAQNKKIPLLRNKGKLISDSYFTSPENRKLVEKIFFEKGVEILSYAANPNPNMRPMGYDNSKTLGFGSYFVTYRNIANNCPVVLWWGDLNASFGINNWYPLFPRITN